MILPLIAVPYDGLLRAREGVAAARAAADRALQAAAQRAGASGQEDFTLAYAENGAPLPSDGWYASRSHSAGLALAAVSRSAIGVDVEGLERENWHAARERALAGELDLIGGAGREEVLCMWTAKEAVLKRAGVGLAGLEHCLIVEYEANDPKSARLLVEFDGARVPVIQRTEGIHLIAAAAEGLEGIELVHVEERGA